jgi:hypothetical protein
LQQTSAEFQLHTLETANSLYDKDTASYERLLAVTIFCEKWSLSVTGVAPTDQKWDLNLDSDEEKFDSTAPVPRRLRAPTKVVPLRGDAVAELEVDGDDEDQDAIMEPSPNDQLEPIDDTGRDDDADAAQIPSRPKLYQPQQILERETQMVFKKSKGKFGAINKRVVDWQERILIKWTGYSVAEATWESDVAYFKEWCSALVEARDKTEIPQILAKRVKHPKTKAGYYKVQWEGSNSSTMEEAGHVESSEKFRGVLKRYNDKNGSSSSSSNSSSSSSSSSTGATIISSTDGGSFSRSNVNRGGTTLVVPK